MKIYAKVDGQHYEFERPGLDSRGFFIGSCAKFCPLCLIGWAHMTAVHYNDPLWGDGPRLDGSHSVKGQVCPRCGKDQKQLGRFHAEFSPIPGSLLEEPQTNCQTLDWDLLDYLPLPLLQREFELHYQFLIAKEQPNGDTAMARPETSPSNVGAGGL